MKQVNTFAVHLQCGEEAKELKDAFKGVNNPKTVDQHLNTFYFPWKRNYPTEICPNEI